MSEALRGDVQDAITAAMLKHGDMVTRWVVVAEVFESTGERGLWAFTAEDMKAWETLGMLTYAAQLLDPDEDDGE